jgi:hypothetical protein
MMHYTEDEDTITGRIISWIDYGTYQLDPATNIRIYPVANVEEARIANGD